MDGVFRRDEFFFFFGTTMVVYSWCRARHAPLPSRDTNHGKVPGRSAARDKPNNLLI